MKTFRSLLLFLSLSCFCFAEQKVVLITGATKGIGLATAKAFQSKGWSVWAGYRQEASAELKEVENINLCHLDVTNDQLVQAAIEMILKKEGKIDALINNAGYGLIGVEECVTIEEAKHIFDVNFFGALRLIQAVLPNMRERGTGHIINISSAVGFHALPGLGLYCSSKFALEGLTESLAASLDSFNIKVSVIEPGFVKNDWGTHCVIGSRLCNEELYTKLNQGVKELLSIPQGQTCEEVANLIVEVSETAQPQVRYQTTTEIKKAAENKLTDPTGTNTQQFNLQFIKRRLGQK